MNNRKNLPKIVLILTIIISILYIFAGNKILSVNMNQYNDTGDYDVYKAKIIEITDVLEENYNLGGEDLIGKLITSRVEILNGDLKGEIVDVTQEINPYMAIQPPEIELGDKILISQSFSASSIEAQTDWTMLEYSRTDAVYCLLGAFFIGLIVFGRKKGILTIISLILTCLSIFLVFIPAIIAGHNIYFWAIQICAFIIIMTLLLVNGANFKSFSAMIGCIGGVCVAGLLTIIMSNILKLTGMIDEQSVFLQMINVENPIDIKAIIFAAIIIGAVGAIMDVAISIASAINEIFEQNPSITFTKLFKSGITIGRDIMGTMTNTLILAYIGSMLSTVLLLIANTASKTYLINTEMIMVEVLQSLVGSMGILMTLPLTSFISAYLYTRKSK